MAISMLEATRNGIIHFVPVATASSKYSGMTSPGFAYAGGTKMYASIAVERHAIAVVVCPRSWQDYLAIVAEEKNEEETWDVEIDD